MLAAAPLFAVADGVGGGSAGELASSEMLAWCRLIEPAEWRSPDALAAKLRESDAALAAALERLSPGGRSATTFAGAWLRRSGRGVVAHVGDSRVLQLRPHHDAWRLTRLTLDQTYAALGEPAPEGGRPDDPARMVGVGAIGEPPVARLRLRETNWLLLCSDGLHRFVPEPTLAALCQRGRGAAAGGGAAARPGRRPGRQPRRHQRAPGAPQPAGRRTHRLLAGTGCEPDGSACAAFLS